jgi:DNA repair protein RadD
VAIVGNCGRGFRLHPSKANCLVLDYGGNVLRHGPVDQVRVKERSLGVGEAPAKECPECNALIAAGYAVCPGCGYEFPPPERQKHDAKASDAGILSGQVTVKTFPVEDVMYSVHTKRGAGDDAPKSMRVDYKLGWHRWQSEWVCFEHEGYPHQKAVAWWKKRSRAPVPATAAEAVEIANAGGLAPTTSITVRSVAGEKYDRITDHEFGPIPEPSGFGDAYESDEPLSDDALDFPFGPNATPAEEEIPW